MCSHRTMTMFKHLSNKLWLDPDALWNWQFHKTIWRLHLRKTKTNNNFTQSYWFDLTWAQAERLWHVHELTVDVQFYNNATIHHSIHHSLHNCLGICVILLICILTLNFFNCCCSSFSAHSVSSHLPDWF